MNPPITVLDTLLRAFEDHVARHAPERGGALMGLRSPDLVTDLVPDEAAAHLPAFYQPSDDLRRRVRMMENTGERWLKGLVHSHPGGMDVPSAHDCRSFADQLRKTPGVGRMIFPIVTCGSPGQGNLEEHEIALPSGKVSFYAAVRATGDRISVSPVRAALNPLVSDLARVGELLNLKCGPLETLQIDGRIALSVTLSGADEVAMVLADAAYPLVPPRLIVSRDGQAGQDAQLTWPWEGDRNQRVTAIATAVDRRRASATVVQTGLAGRTGVAGELASGLRAVVLGAGSVGSLMAEQLVRSGVRRLTLIDPDTVEAVNLSRTVYEAGDLGRLKVSALADRLARINPGVEVTGIGEELAAIAPDRLAEAVGAADVMVGACDDPAAQATLNHLSFQAGVPGVFVMLYRAAAGGEVVWTFPPTGTACYRCATATRHGYSRRPETDYRTGRLAGEVGLGADIASVTSAASKIALALGALRRAVDLPDIPEDGISNFLLEPALTGRTFVMFGNTPAFDFFPRVFERTAGQYAWQTVWMRVDPDPACPVCGTQRVPANEVDPAGPDLTAVGALATAETADAPAPGAGAEPGRPRRGR